MAQNHIRNFSIIAHIDHGKSTLADRMLELTHTVDARLMRDQYLDQMDLERERGITIKMQPVRMVFRTENHAEARSTKSEARNNFGFRDSNFEFSDSEQYVLNLIDTPGHIDFSYEVSRALGAVEGAVLLVDATQGVQAQTVSVLEIARAQKLVIIPVVNKIDLPHSRVRETKEELAALMGVDAKDVLEVSAKTGAGVPELLNAVVARIPSPRPSAAGNTRALVFDFAYSSHKGVVAYVRMFDGALRRGSPFMLKQAGARGIAADVGVFLPKPASCATLEAGMIGYVTTQIKEPRVVRVGDTLTDPSSPAPALEGYREPSPVIWASVYPASQDAFDELFRSLETLRLSDSALYFEEEQSGALGRGFRCGFLGSLHVEIVVERLRREHHLDIVLTAPTVTYALCRNNVCETIYAPHRFVAAKNMTVREPWVRAEILTPEEHIGAVMRLLPDYEGSAGEAKQLGANRLALAVLMPLRELMRGFFDRLKSASSGFASLSYVPADMRPADVVRIDVHVADEDIPAFARIVGRRRVEEEAERVVESLSALLPRQLFAVKVQAVAEGRIVRSRTVPALHKNVTGHLYGGDRTRKMKLWQKQKRGKKRLKAAGKVRIPESVFVKMLQAR